MKQLSDEEILASWKKNVSPWRAAIQNGEIASRVEVTNQAIVDAVIERSPSSVLDVGCGEGWLVRRLADSGIDALGIDAVSEFIECGTENDGRFRVLSHEDLSIDSVGEKFDVVVSNFSLLGKESVDHVFQQVPSLLNQAGAFIVQTIHPVAGCGEGKYEDGWRQGSWDGFSDEFCDPAPWYFRTVDSWKLLFEKNGFTLNHVREPLNPRSGSPASIVFTGTISA